MGIPDQFQQFPAAPSNIRTHNIAGFFQDDDAKPFLREPQRGSEPANATAGD